MQKVAKHFEAYVRQSEHAPFDYLTNTGHWKTLTVRTTRKGDLLLWPIIDAQNLDVVAKEKVKETLKKFMSENEDVTLRPTSLHLQFVTRKEKGKNKFSQFLSINNIHSL